MSLAARYREVRARTEALAAPLSPEDQQLQSMPSCSPTKWHRAHTTWFFETFVLKSESPWARLFNSYYEAVGPRHPRPRRGMLSRPSCDQIAAYRAAIDARMIDYLAGKPDDPLVELGLAHEEQHQELILTDALHALSENPLLPAYRGPAPTPRTTAPAPMTFARFEGGLVQIGHADASFAFDNEGPRHQVWLEPFGLADRLVAVAEVDAFIADGGYRTAALWLSDGWDLVQQHGWTAPGHVLPDGQVFSLDGARARSPDEPAMFLSFYEADAIARWMSARLPTEAEWEHAAVTRGLRYGVAWEWTRSSYEPYPGYQVPDGAIGEYNGKWMNNQRVLRGGSMFTPPGHVRPTYRNFWPPDTRFQVTGLRLAR